MPPKENGPKSLHFEFFLSTSNVLEGKVFFRNLKKIQSFKSPAWLLVKVFIFNMTQTQTFTDDDISPIPKGESKPFIKNIFTLNTCAHIVGSQVIEFTKEADLLASWREFVAEVDPDLLIGYNISQFDLPYLIDRAKALKVTKFPFFGRLKGKGFHLASI